MKPEIFVLAAELIPEHRFACVALIHAAERPEAAEVYINFLASYFKESNRDAWLGYLDPLSQEARTLALLICAEICKDINNDAP